MRRYVEDGGMILVNADCGRGGFIGSVKKLAGELFPAYELRELPESHPIYTERFPRSKWKNKPSVLSVGNGARELMILIPSADAGRTWQVGVSRGREDHWQLAANVASYAADPRSLGYKGDTHLVADDPAAKTTATIKVGRLKYKGNWDPEPGGWRRLRNVLRAGDGVDLDVKAVDLGVGLLDGVKLAHLTGTNKLPLGDAGKAQLRKFVEAGGTLLVDAAGGSAAFATALEAELNGLLPGGILETLPAAYPLVDGLRVAYRPFAQKTLAGRADSPHLKAILVKGRPAVLFSREDLSVGLVGHPVGGVIGYEPATATQLVRRVVLNAAGVKSHDPTTKPATKPVAAKGGQ